MKVQTIILLLILMGYQVIGDLWAQGGKASPQQGQIMIPPVKMSDEQLFEMLIIRFRKFIQASFTWDELKVKKKWKYPNPEILFKTFVKDLRPLLKRYKVTPEFLATYWDEIVRKGFEEYTDFSPQLENTYQDYDNLLGILQTQQLTGEPCLQGEILDQTIENLNIRLQLIAPIETENIHLLALESQEIRKLLEKYFRQMKKIETQEYQEFIESEKINVGRIFNHLQLLTNLNLRLDLLRKRSQYFNQHLSSIPGSEVTKLMENSFEVTKELFEGGVDIEIKWLQFSLKTYPEDFILKLREAYLSQAEDLSKRIKENEPPLTARDLEFNQHAETIFRQRVNYLDLQLSAAKTQKVEEGEQDKK
jgi:hypothetical protein